MRIRSSTWLACLGASVVACGGASQTELFSPPSDDGGSGNSIADTGRLATDTSVGAVDVSAPDTSTGPKIDSSIADTSPPPVADTAPPPSTTLPCGAGQPDCPTGGQEVCCVTGDIGNLSFGCTDKAMCTGTPISCTSTADCAGAICCGVETGSGTATRYVHVSCAATCDGVYFCDPAANDCPNGTACSASMLLPGYFVCR